MWKGFFFSTPSPAFIICRLFDDGTPLCYFVHAFKNVPSYWFSILTFPSGLGTTSLQWDSGCVRESECQWRAGCLWGLTAREYISTARASGICARRPWAQSPRAGWLGRWWDAAGNVAAFIWGVDGCFPRGILLTVGSRDALRLRTNSIHILKIRQLYLLPEA